MMDAAYREDMIRKAAADSRRRGTKPHLITEAEGKEIAALREGDSLPDLFIPFIGNRVPRGYKPTDTCLFVDTSGFGESGEEPALTMREFLKRLRPGFAYALVELGQFQGYVQEFSPPKVTAGKERSNR